MQKDQVILTMQTPPPTRPTLTRLPASRPKSRFLDLNYPPPLHPPPPTHSDDPNSSDSDVDDIFLTDHTSISAKLRPSYRRPIGPRALLEIFSLIILTTSTLTLLLLLRPTSRFCSLDLWEWSLMLLIIVSGRLLANWLVWTVVFFIEKNFPLKEKVLYFVFGLRRSVRSCVWLALVLLAWSLLLFERRGLHLSKPVQTVSRALVAILIAATIWLVKIVLVKILASSFHVATFFDRMKESVFHHYILEKLSGDPKSEKEEEEEEEEFGGGRYVTRRKTMPARVESRRVDIESLRRLSRARATACGVKRLVGHVMRTGLSTVSRTVDRASQKFGEAEADIRSEWEARAAAERVFVNVAHPGNK